MIPETSWWATDRKDNAAATASHAAEPNTKHVITGIYAAFSGTATKTLLIKEDTTTKITLDVVNSLSLDNLEIEFDTNKEVSAVLEASGSEGVYGSVLLNGYTK